MSSREMPPSPDQQGPHPPNAGGQQPAGYPQQQYPPNAGRPSGYPQYPGGPQQYPRGPQQPAGDVGRPQYQPGVPPQGNFQNPYQQGSGRPYSAATSNRVPSNSKQAFRQKTKRQKLSKKAIFGLVAGLIVIAALVVAYLVVSASFSPQKTAEKYLAAIVEGKAETVLDISEANLRSGERALLTNEIYEKATNRPTEFEIGNAYSGGGSGRSETYYIDASLTMDMKKYPIQLEMSKTGSKYLFFSTWQVNNPIDGWLSIEAYTPKVTVNGVEIDLSNAVDDNQEWTGSMMVNLPALPGTYTVSGPASDETITYGDPETATVGLDGETSGSVEVKPSFAPAVLDQVKTQINDHYAQGMQSDKFTVQGFDELEMDDPRFMSVTGINRSWKEEPKIELVPDSLTSENGTYKGTAEFEAELVINYKQRYSEKDAWEQARYPVERNVYETFDFTISDGKVNVIFD